MSFKLENNQRISESSRSIKPGDTFVAIKGHSSDGHDFIKDAIKNGAATVIVDQRYYKNHSDLPKDVNVVISQDSKKELSDILKSIYKIPENIVGITGTNGKTSTAYFYKQITELSGGKSASIGTLGVVSSENSDFFSKMETLTTPGVSQLYSLLGGLKKCGVENVSMEVSSHGLDQGRVSGLTFNAAAFTSFSQDHLDYHGTMDKYFDAKMKLFSEFLSPKAVAVINSDMDITDKTIQICKALGHKVFTYGKKGEFVKMISSEFVGDKTNVEFILDGEKVSKSLSIIGGFQVENILCALALSICTGFDKDRCLASLELISSVPGRMQIAGKNVIVDYAHTDDALRKAMGSMKEIMREGKLIVVFGCGGDRDRAKRRLMGEVVQELADIAIVTDDNPRTEDPSSIRAEIMKYCKGGIEIDGRREAIKKAIEIKGDKDFVLIAGKGHENYQILGTEKVHFDDVETVQEFLV